MSRRRVTGVHLQKRTHEVGTRDEWKCRMCGRVTRVTDGETDHIIPLKDGGEDDRYDLSNLQWLCKLCHEVKTARDMGYVVKGCDVDGMPLDPASHWRK